MTQFRLRLFNVFETFVSFFNESYARGTKVKHNLESMIAWKFTKLSQRAVQVGLKEEEGLQVKITLFRQPKAEPVSYTHLTLPTILLV